MANHDADKGQGHRRQDYQRQLEAAKLRHHKDVNPQKRHAKGRPHVAEGDPCHLPLTIPQHGGHRLVLGHAVQADVGLGQIAPISRFNRAVDGDDPVKRRLIIPREFCRDHFGRAAIVTEDRMRLHLGFHLNHIAEFHHRPIARQQVRRKRRRERPFVQNHIGLVACQTNGQRLPPIRTVRIAHGRTAI